MATKNTKKLEKVISEIINNNPAAAKKLMHEVIIEMARDLHAEMELKENDEFENENEDIEDHVESIDHKEPDGDEDGSFNDDDEDNLELDSEENVDDDLELDSEENEDNTELDSEENVDDDLELDSEENEDNLDLDVIGSDIEEVEDAINDMNDVPEDLEAAFEKLKKEFENMSSEENTEEEEDSEENTDEDSEEEYNMGEDSDTSLENEIKEAYELEKVFLKNNREGSEINTKSPTARDADFLNLGKMLEIGRGEKVNDPNGSSAQTPSKKAELLGKFRNQIGSQGLEKVAVPKNRDGRVLGEAKKEPAKKTPSKDTKKITKKPTPKK